MKKEPEITKVKEKKMIKRKRLYDSAFELFINKGINNTTIDDIVKKAKVAKGTFYLYFRSKYDIVDMLILRKSSIILGEVMEKTRHDVNYSKEDFNESIIIFIEYLIEHLKNNKRILKFIYKNLSWGFFRKALKDNDNAKEMQEIANLFINNLKNKGADQSEAEKLLFIIIELTGSVCYSSIILQEPDTIENMKPVLFASIKKIMG